MEKKLLFSIMGLWIIIGSYLMLSLTSCVFNYSPELEISGIIGIDVTNGKIVTFNDTHGGPHGEGQNFIAIQFDDDSTIKEIEKNNLWNPLPLSKNLITLAYGDPDGGPFLTDANGSEFPKVQNGYFYFLDKQAEKDDQHDDSKLMGDDRYSFNFIVAIYDSDKNILYYAQFDT